MSFNLPKSSMVSRLISTRRYTTSVDVCTAGSIRAAGGTFGRLEAAREQDYFLKKQHEQLIKLKENRINEEIFHQKQILDLEGELRRHKESLKRLRKM